MKGSAAEKAGLQYGQRVQQINGISLNTGQDNCQYHLAGFGFDTMEELRLTILNEENTIQEVILNKEQY